MDKPCVWIELFSFKVGHRGDTQDTAMTVDFAQEHWTQDMEENDVSGNYDKVKQL